MLLELRTALQIVPEHEQAPIAWDYNAARVLKLFEGGVPGMHFYCMSRSGPTIEILKRAVGRRWIACRQERRGPRMPSNAARAVGYYR